MLVVVCLLGAAMAADAPSVGPQAFLNNGVTAHRGFSSAYPENTLAAFEAAIALGVDWVELDIFKSADGQLVVCHDASTKRLAEKSLLLAKSSYAEIAALDIAHGYRERHGLSVESCPVMRVPLLREVLVLFMAQEKTRVSIQPKMPIVREAIALIAELGATRWVGFNDGDLGLMREVKALAPTIPVFWDRPAKWDLPGDIAIAKEAGFESLVIHYKGITEAVVRAIRAAGIEAGVWTVNDPEVMKHLIAQGVERFYTDYPDKLLALRR